MTYYRSKRLLAMAYDPTISPSSAVNKLRDMIINTPGLMEALLETGYRTHSRVLTHKQEEIIQNRLGEP